MDYYKILDLPKTATAEDIKKAYRSLAMKHHPDRGGDQKEFQKIQEAYATLSDPQKRSEYDNPHTQSFDEDVMGQFFRSPFGFNFRSAPRNPNTQVAVEITLEDAFNGRIIDAQIGSSTGQTRLVSIEIPPGVEDGMQIKYRGMGENFHPKIPPGDLIVNVRVQRHHIWERSGDNLIYEKTVSAWDAIIGSSLNITTIDGKHLNIGIPAGTQPDTILSCKGEGMPNMRTKQRGNLLVRIKVTIPKNLSNDDIEKVKKIKNELSTRTS
jgi:curved DNA-binding protein